jgi:hypothetical protein
MTPAQELDSLPRSEVPARPGVLESAAVVFLLIAGVLLWFSRVNNHFGKELLESERLIGICIEFGVPVLMSIHY